MRDTETHVSGWDAVFSFFPSNLQQASAGRMAKGKRKKMCLHLIMMQNHLPVVLIEEQNTCEVKERAGPETGIQNHGELLVE